MLCPWTMGIHALHIPWDLASCFQSIWHAVILLCTLGRLEVDDDATYWEDGLHVDSYGDECGEWVSETGVRWA